MPEILTGPLLISPAAASDIAILWSLNESALPPLRGVPPSISITDPLNDTLPPIAFIVSSSAFPLLLSFATSLSAHLRTDLPSLRPIAERRILPTVAYVAGPGEMAYFAQVPDDDTEAEFFAFRDSEICERMRARELPLLTDDLTDVAVMVNSQLEIRDAIRPRGEVEFPRLRRMAGEIAALIRSEYP